jgi:hypothetical protein
MRHVGAIIIEHEKITTPSGQYPLNGNSAVWVRSIPRNQYVKKTIGLGFLAATVFTGGARLLLCAPGFALIFHESYQVVVNTNGAEFVIETFKAVAILKEPNKRAEELKDAIGQVIEEQRLPSGTEFHYASGDKITGPVSAADLQHLARDRIINSDTSIYSVELREWKPLRDVL